MSNFVLVQQKVTIKCHFNFKVSVNSFFFSRIQIGTRQISFGVSGGNGALNPIKMVTDRHQQAERGIQRQLNRSW